jgi:integrase/recombinase XerD
MQDGGPVISAGQNFFVQRLLDQRQVSPATLSSYRDTFRLLLAFVAQKTKRSASDQLLEDWDAPQVLDFLDYLEAKRGNCARSRNARLAAIRSFMRYVCEQEPGALALAQRVLAIPQKRFERPLLGYLSLQEIKTIIQAPDPRTPQGQRDRLLWMLLFNTGARVSEVIGLNRKDIDLSGRSVRLRGKGRKQRCLPLWKSTVAELKTWLPQMPDEPESPVFLNRSGKRMTRFGVNQRLRLAVQNAAAHCPELKSKSISPHTFRHSMAMHLLQGGIDIANIALWLGHESPATTHHYIESDMAMKQATLDRISPPKTKKGRFQPKDKLLAFLAAL